VGSGNYLLMVATTTDNKQSKSNNTKKYYTERKARRIISAIASSKIKETEDKIMFAVTRIFSPLAKAGMATSRVRLTLTKLSALVCFFGLSLVIHMHLPSAHHSPSPLNIQPYRQPDLLLRKLRKLPRLLRNLVALVFSSESIPFLSALG
jgi:hypothetical protein